MIVKTLFTMNVIHAIRAKTIRDHGFTRNARVGDHLSTRTCRPRNSRRGPARRRLPVPPTGPSARLTVRRPPVRWLVMDYREKQRRMLRLRRHPDLSRAIPRSFSVNSAVRKMINEVARGFTAGAHKLDSGAVTVAVRQVPEQTHSVGMTHEQPRDPSQGHDCHPLPRADYHLSSKGLTHSRFTSQVLVLARILARARNLDRLEERTKFIRLKVDIAGIGTSGTPHDYYTFLCRYLDAFTGLAVTRPAPIERRALHDFARLHTSHSRQFSARPFQVRNVSAS